MSNQLEMIQKLYAKMKTYKIPAEPKEGQEQIEMEITPLSLEDMGLMNMKEDMPMDELAKNAKVMFSRSLNIPEEDAGKISLSFMEEIFNAIMDVNNFNEADAKGTGIKDFINKKKEQQEANDAKSD